VRITGRSAQGVTLLRLDDGERVTSCFPVMEEEEPAQAGLAGTAAEGGAIGMTEPDGNG
jgi:DNA gyrase subunit A